MDDVISVHQRPPGSLYARLDIQLPKGAFHGAGRFARSSAPSRIDWPAKLDMLRSLNLDAEGVRTQAAQLLDGCGFLPVVNGRPVQWTAEHIDEDLLSRIKALQDVVRALDSEATQQVASAYATMFRSRKARSTARPALKMSELEKGMVEYLKKQRADVPPKEAPKDAKYLPALFEAVANTAREAGESFERVMQRITGMQHRDVTPKELLHPDAALIQLLNEAAYNIRTTVTFDKRKMPVVMMEPQEPVAALLLKAHESVSLRSAKIAPCRWCGTWFEKERSDALCCSPRCKNNLKKTRQRARQA